jgi:phosphoenolpyruvate carboxykinase (GTP)
VHGEVGALRSPTGLIPKYEDLVPLFKQVLKNDYPREAYVAQFTVRIPENLAKVERVEDFHHKKVSDSPALLFEVLAAQKARLLEAQKKYGDYASPLDLPEA